MAVVLASLLLGCVTGDGGAPPAPGTASTASELTREIVVELDFPAGRSLTEFAIVAAEVDVDASAKLTTAGGKYAGVAHTGTGLARVGRGAALGTLLSIGDIAVFDQAQFHGDLRTSGVISSPPPAAYYVHGTAAEHQAIPLRKLTRRASFGPNAPAVRVGPGAPATTLAPGAYASADVLPGSELVLRAGAYYFDSLTVLAGAKLTIDDRAGSVFVYVGGALRVEGAIARSTPGFPRWLVTVLGATPIVLSGPFRGALVAPNASVNISATPTPHEGAFYGKKVHVANGARVVHRVMPWVISSVTFDRPSACAGDTIGLKVDAPGATISIDDTPVDQMFDQVIGAPGEKLYAIRAIAADGTSESQLARLPVTACPSGQALRPTLVAQPNPLVPDAVSFTVMNAPDLGDVTYTWSFGDGTTASGPNAAVNHTFVDAVPKGSQYAKFDVAVTVKRAGSPDVTATRSFVVWSSYEMSRARGLLEPPTAPIDPLLKANTAGLGGEIHFTNREDEVLTYDRRRIDLVPCDGDAALIVGGDESAAVVVPARGSLRTPITVSSTLFTDKVCGAVVHHWGSTASGIKAHAAVPFERASKLGKGAPVDATTTNVLNHLVKSGALTAGKRVSASQLLELYQARLIPKTALSTAYSGPADGGIVPREPCDPEDPGPPPMPGFSCQPTGKWEGADDPTQALDDRIQNAWKGDTVLVRSCGGMLAPLLGALKPAQLFTHTGIMTKHRSQIAHSTGSIDWLRYKQANGTGGLPSDAFKENGLRFLWPGTIVASVREAFVTGRELKTPEGETLSVSGFHRDEVRCTGDSQIVHPLVLKPDPIFETSTRSKLMAAADAAKTIHGHYRFASYSKAPATADPDPKGPSSIPNASALGPSYGPAPTVCSSFVRFSLKTAGFELDRDKGFPMLSDARGDAADGLFFYDADERKAAADRLYAGLYNDIEHALALVNAKTDNYWWKSVVDPEPGWMAIIGMLLPPGTTGTLTQWATDAPDDVASQVTNCFASDFCSEDAKDSDAWQEPGTGIAVSPDDMLNHYDSPRTGGPYGHSERMIYRGPDFRPVYEWRPVEGSIPVTVHVVNLGKDVESALVTIPGFLTTPLPTLTDGRLLIEGVPRGNILIHAQKFFPEPAPGSLREANVCYVPASKTSNDLLLVDCKDFSKVLDPTPVKEATLTLQPPREEFRKVILSAKPRLEDCDCGEPNDIATHSLFEVCNVSPLTRVDTVSVGSKDMCVDEVGLSFDATCTLQDDNRTVRITGTFKFFEDAADSCGADEKEDEKSFDVKVGPGVITPVPISTLYNYDVCGLADCNDTANINEFKIQNQVAD